MSADLSSHPKWTTTSSVYEMKEHDVGERCSSLMEFRDLLNLCTEPQKRFRQTGVLLPVLRNLLRTLQVGTNRRRWRRAEPGMNLSFGSSGSSYFVLKWSNWRCMWCEIRRNMIQKKPKDAPQLGLLQKSVNLCHSYINQKIKCLATIPK